MSVIDRHDYKVRARGLKDWQRFDRVRLEISVGQTYHEGDKLSAILAWARDNFDRVDVILGDTTQRYNLIINGMTPDQALDHADRMGRHWLFRNRLRLEAVPGLTVHRWDKWRMSRDFANVLDQVKTLYGTNDQFMATLDAEIAESFARRLRRGECTESDQKTHANLSLTYLLEETAVFALAYRDLPGLSAYPGSFGEMWSMFVGTDVPGAPEGLKNAHCVQLSFNHRINQDQSLAA